MKNANSLLMDLEEQMNMIDHLDTTAEYPMTLCTYSGMIANAPIITNQQKHTCLHTAKTKTADISNSQCNATKCKHAPLLWFLSVSWKTNPQ